MVCGKKGARVRKVTETYGKGRSLLVLENIPMVNCPNCGESHFTPLESPAICGGDNINKASIPYRKGGVKAPSFLTGFTAATLHEIERIKLHRKSLAVEHPVEIARFA